MLQGRGHVLNINTVVHILMEFKERLNWEDTLTHVMYAEAPARFRCVTRVQGVWGGRIFFVLLLFLMLCSQWSVCLHECE